MRALSLALLALLPACRAFSPAAGPLGGCVDMPLGRAGRGVLLRSCSRFPPPTGLLAERGQAAAAAALGIRPAWRLVLPSGRGLCHGVGLRAAQGEGEGEVDTAPFKDALVDFKGAPCVVTSLSEKAEILQLNGKSRKAKYKDLQIVFPGPVRSWELQELAGKPLQPVESPDKVHAELLGSADTMTVSELAQKLFRAEPTHAQAWAAWTLVQEGLYFTGTSEEIAPHPAEKVAKDLEAMRLKKVQEKEQADFVKRIKTKTIKPADIERLHDLEDLALYRAESSPTLKMLGIQQKPQEAHNLLIELGVWDSMTNPWPARFGIVMEDFGERLDSEAERAIGRAKALPREDLTALDAFAIDDAGIADPDDAISVTQGEGEELMVWVHVADVGAVVPPDSELDLAARRRGASCYLPNGTFPMLPEKIQEHMGLGLAPTSPALSIGFRLEDDGHIDDVRVVRSTVKVTRKSYEEAAALIEAGDAPWSLMEEASFRYRDRRLENGAVGFQMPQAAVKVDAAGEISVGVQTEWSSRDVVMEMMLMAGEAISQYALDKELPFLYSTQGPLKDLSPPKAPPKNQLLKGGRLPPKNPFEIAKEQKEANEEVKQERIGPPTTLADKFEFRKRFDRSRVKSAPDMHTGLGMAMYCQISSPLRRYGDLLLHQQLHASLEGAPVLEAEELLERAADVEEQVVATKKAERFSAQFYTLNWLKRHPGWAGSGTCVALWQPRPGAPKIATVLLEDLAFFTNVRCKADVKLDSPMKVEMSRVRLVDMKADMKHLAEVAALWGSEEAEMHRKEMKARKQVGTRMGPNAKAGG